MAENQSLDPSQVEWILYQEAYEQSSLWHLLYAESIDGRFDEDFAVVYPRLTREEIIPVLRALLDRGDVGLYDEDDIPERHGIHDASDPTHLPRERAVEVIANPAYWAPETAPAMICLVITEAGLERWRAMPQPEFERRPREP